MAFAEGDESKIIPPSVKGIAYGNWTTGCRGMASLSPFPLPLEGNELTLCHDLINPHSDPTNRHCYFHFTDEETEAHQNDMPRNESLKKLVLLYFSNMLIQTI